MFRSPQNRSITSQNDGQVGLAVRQVGAVFEVGQNDVGVPLDEGSEAICLFADLGSIAAAEQQQA